MVLWVSCHFNRSWEKNDGRLFLLFSENEKVGRRWEVLMRNDILCSNGASDVMWAGESCYNVTTSHHHQHHQYTSPCLVPSFLLYLLYIYVYSMELKIEQLLTSRMSILSNQLLEQGKMKSWIIKFFFKWFYFTTSLLNSEIFKSYWAQTTTALAQKRAY